MTDIRPIQIKPHHVELKAAVYNRVSTPHQAEESLGSLAHQRDQQEYPLAWGWREDQIDLYLGDLGVSASGGVNRADWQRLLREVANHQVGAVFSADHDRLSRRASDFRTLLDLCCVSDTLLVIDGVIVDPNDPNDRFVAGIHAEFAEFENAHRAERMRKAKYAQAKGGYTVSRVPVGYVAVRGKKGLYWVKHRNPQVRQRISDIFCQYEIHGSVRKVLLWCKEHHLKLPTDPAGNGQIDWKDPSAGRIYNILKNPAYCGSYRFGLREAWPRGNSGKTRSVPQEKWIVKPGQHSGYIPRATFDRIQERLWNNRIRDYNQPVGRGDALCQGLVLCGVCGRHLQTRYQPPRGGKRGQKTYVCRGANAQFGDPTCSRIDGDILDALVEGEVLRAFAPPEVEALLLAGDDLNGGHTALQQQRQEELERTRSRAQLLKAHVLQIDPKKRLAAAELHKDLDEALAQVQDLERRHREQPLTPPLRLTRETIEEIRSLAADIPNLWRDIATTNEDRKRLVRLVVREIRLISASPTGWEVDIVWAGGAVSRHALLRPWGWRAAARELVAQGLTPAAIAERLRQYGFRTWRGRPVTASLVRMLSHPRRSWLKRAEERRAAKLARQSAQPAGA